MFSRPILKKLVAEVSAPILFSMIQDAASGEKKEIDDDLIFNLETCIAELRRRQQQQPKPAPTPKPAKPEKVREDAHGHNANGQQHQEAQA